MDIVYESARNYQNLLKVKYHFVFSINRKKNEITLDFMPSDFKHAAGLHYIDDIVIEKDPEKVLNAILSTKNPKITDSVLEKSEKYGRVCGQFGSVKNRISDMRYLEKCLDESQFLRIYKNNGSVIEADYTIETYSEDINNNIYIFIRKREESNNYVIVSFFRKSKSIDGTNVYWMLKEKIIELFKHKNYE